MLPLPVQAVLLYRILRDVVPCLYLIDLHRLLVLAVAGTGSISATKRASFFQRPRRLPETCTRPRVSEKPGSSNCKSSSGSELARFRFARAVSSPVSIQPRNSALPLPILRTRRRVQTVDQSHRARASAPFH